LSFQEDRTRVEIFLDYAAKRKETVWGPFLSLLNRSDGFIVHMASRIIAKLACWGQDQMPKSDLNFYLQWLKDQLTLSVSLKFLTFIICTSLTGLHLNVTLSCFNNYLFVNLPVSFFLFTPSFICHFCREKKITISHIIHRLLLIISHAHLILQNKKKN
jgi:V-ATPase subunit H